MEMIDPFKKKMKNIFLKNCVTLYLLEKKSCPNKGQKEGDGIFLRESQKRKMQPAPIHPQRVLPTGVKKRVMAFFFENSKKEKCHHSLFLIPAWGDSGKKYTGY